MKDVIWEIKVNSANKLDDDHNGYIDDVHGWNFMGSSKGSFHFDNIDLVRELRTEIKKDPNSAKAKQLQQQFNDRRDRLEGGKKIIERQRNILNHIVKQIGKQYPTISEFENYKYRNAEEADFYSDG